MCGCTNPLRKRYLVRIRQRATTSATQIANTGPRPGQPLLPAAPPSLASVKGQVWGRSLPRCRNPCAPSGNPCAPRGNSCAPRFRSQLRRMPLRQHKEGLGFQRAMISVVSVLTGLVPEPHSGCPPGPFSILTEAGGAEPPFCSGSLEESGFPLSSLPASVSSSLK